MKISNWFVWPAGSPTDQMIQRQRNICRPPSPPWGKETGGATHPGGLTGSVKSSRRQRGPTGPQLLSVHRTSVLIGAGWRWGWAGLVERLRDEGLKWRTGEVKGVGG